MQKLIVASLLLATSSMATLFVDELPQGNYSGEGQWFSYHDGQREEGSYQVAVEIIHNELLFRYQWEHDGIIQEQSVRIAINFEEPGHFLITPSHGIAGEGYCDLPTSCVYAFSKDGEFRGEERLTFGHDGQRATLVKEGHERLSANHVVQWTDALTMLP